MRLGVFYNLFVVLFVVISAALVLASPFFDASEIEVEGCVRFDRRDILGLCGADGPVNVFAYSLSKHKEDIKREPYIEEITLKRNYLLRTLTFNVKERRLSGYVEYPPGTFIYIDENGRVLEIQNKMDEPLPVAKGLAIRNFVAGELLEVEDSQSFDTLVELSGLYKKYELENDIIRVDLSDSGNTIISVNNIDVELGDINDADQKIRILKEILKTTDSEKMRGTLYINDVNKAIRFRTLT